jgi:serine/threonine-protein kinase
MRARLSEEARLATYLQDPRIARVLGSYEVEGVLYVVSERVEGTSINTLISYSLQRKAVLPPAFCLYVSAEVASALHHAHTRTDESGAPLGIVHRDVNPARIYLGSEGEVVLTDFARARSMLPGRVETTLPRPEGDVFYCSPEALLGEETDPRSDLFSLGLVLLELATWGHLYSTANARLADLEEALTPDARKQILEATINALRLRGEVMSELMFFRVGVEVLTVGLEQRRFVNGRLAVALIESHPSRSWRAHPRGRRGPPCACPPGPA